MGRLIASPLRGPFGPSPHTGGASVLAYAGPFELGKVQALVDFALGLVDSQPSEAWDTGVVVVSCEDVPTFADFHTVLQLHTAVGLDQPVASVVAGSHAAGGAVGDRPDLVTSFVVEQPCVVAYLVRYHDTMSHIEAV